MERRARTAEKTKEEQAKTKKDDTWDEAHNLCRVQSELLLNNLKSFLHSLQGGHNWIRRVLGGGERKEGQQRALARIKTSVKAETDAVPERWQAKDFYKNLIWPKRSRTKELWDGRALAEGGGRGCHGHKVFQTLLIFKITMLPQAWRLPQQQQRGRGAERRQRS